VLPLLRCRRCAAAAALPPLRCRICAAATALPQLRCRNCTAATVLLPASATAAVAAAIAAAVAAAIAATAALRCRQRFQCWSLDFNDFISHSKKREAEEEGKNNVGLKKLQ
jgi:hypothetical protein